MGLFNTSKEMLDAIKSIVTDGRKQYSEEQQEMDKIVAEKILSPKQKKIAAVAGDKDKIDAADFAALRGGKKVAEATGNPGPVRKPVPASFKEKPSKEDMAAWHAKQKEEVDLEEGKRLDSLVANLKGARAHLTGKPEHSKAAADAHIKAAKSNLSPHYKPQQSGKENDVSKGTVGDKTWSHLHGAKYHSINKEEVESVDEMSSKEKMKKGLYKKEAVERDTPGQHSCAVHVKHSTFGEGKALYSQHAEPDEAGLIEWYDIMFEHGIEKQVPTSDLEVLEAMSHGNHKGKK
jgi:hypothetical protein